MAEELEDIEAEIAELIRLLDESAAAEANRPGASMASEHRSATTVFLLERRLASDRARAIRVDP